MEKEVSLMPPNVLAKVFWEGQDRYSIDQMFKMMIERTKGKEQKNLKKTYKDIYTNRPPGKPLSDIETEAIWNLTGLIPEREIRNKLDDLKISENEIKKVIHVLFPYPLDNLLVSGKRPPVAKKKDEHEHKIISEAKKKIKQLSGIEGQFKKINQESYFRGSLPFDQALNWITYCKNSLEEILKYHEKRQKDLLIDHNLQKQAQSHMLWGQLIKNAVNILNPYCHDRDCNTNACIKTHLTAVKKVAELLKVLHPNIWKEDINMITAKIKTRYYSSL